MLYFLSIYYAHTILRLKIIAMIPILLMCHAIHIFHSAMRLKLISLNSITSPYQYFTYAGGLFFIVHVELFHLDNPRIFLFIKLLDFS
jgi:hypothetical protein